MHISDTFNTLRSHLTGLGMADVTLSINSDGIAFEFATETLTMREKALADVLACSDREGLLTLLNEENDLLQGDLNALEAFMVGNH